MKQYLALLNYVLKNGIESEDRRGTGTRRVVGRTLRVNLTRGFPLLTTKKMFFKGIATELLWFISGETNIRPLVLEGVNIWNEWPYSRYLRAQGLDPKLVQREDPSLWKAGMQKFVQNISESPEFAYEWGDLGPVYGYQWRHWRTHYGTEIDQLARVVNEIKVNPNSRRLIVTAWNPSDIDEMSISGLPPCHMTYQFFVINGKLSCLMYQRSVDTFLGLPFNIASYALLTHMVAHVTGLIPHELVLSLGDTHIYLNHLDQVNMQLSRTPRKLPKLAIKGDVTDIDSFSLENFEILGYNPHPAIKAEISV